MLINHSLPHRLVLLNLVVACPRYCNGQPEGPVTSRIKSRSPLRCTIRHAAKRVVARSSHCLGWITAARGRYRIAIKRRRSSAHPIAVPVAPAPAAIVRRRPVVIDRSRPVIGIWIWPCQCAADYCAGNKASQQASADAATIASRGRGRRRSEGGQPQSRCCKQNCKRLLHQSLPARRIAVERADHCDVR